MLVTALLAKISSSLTGLFTVEGTAKLCLHVDAVVLRYGAREMATA